MINDIITQKKIVDTLECVGDYGPLLLFALSLVLLSNKGTILYVYICGIVVGYMLNPFLKGIIQEIRPINNLNINSWIDQEYHLYPQRYGMPSRHVQGVVFSLTFICLTLKNFKISILYVFFSLVTMYQRIASKGHSLSQTLVGALAGSLLGWCFYMLACFGVIVGK